MNKLAIISLSTFGYFERMAIASTTKGVKTKFFDERPQNDIWTKMFLRVMPKRVAQTFAKNHMQKVCNEILNNGYTHVMIVFAETIQEKDLVAFKQAGISLSRFTWDSVGNRNHVQKFDHLMEAIGSFDPVDCTQYGYSYIPLYCESIKPDAISFANDRNFDFYFCGTMHTDRPNLIHEIDNLCNKHGWVPKWDLFYHSRWLYKIQNARNPRAISLFDRISDKPFSHTETLRNTNNAHVIIDIHHAKQSGLTMRTFEALAQGAILLTTNKRALELVDIELHERVVILDRDNLESCMMEAMARIPGPLKDSQYYELSIDRFLDQIFDLINVKLDLQGEFSL